jgi:hypothetical protein
MATSGTTIFDLQIDDLIAEAFERCGMQITNGHQLSSARRSLNLMFLDWANRGLNLWTIEEVAVTLTGTTSITLPADTVQVLTAVIRDFSQSPAVDITIDPITRAEYLDVPDKSTQARPSQFYVQRTNPPEVFFYPTPGGGGGPYQFRYYRIRRIQDAGDYTNTTDVNFRFLPCLTAGLAYYLSVKFAPDRTMGLKQMYDEEWARAAAEDRETARISFVPQLGV